MKGKNLHLGTEDELQEGSKEKKGRVAKGSHSSKNAYMLVYSRQGTQTTTVNPDELAECLSQGVQQYAMRDNEKFEEWMSDLLTAKENKIVSGKVEQVEIQESFQSLFHQEGCEYDWLGVDWLNKWLADPAKAPSIKNQQYLCQHQKLNPDMVSKLKCVNSQGATSLVEKYEADIRLEGEQTLCWKCVKHQCHVIQMKQRMVGDEKRISTEIKFAYDSELGYWVGRSSLRSWKKLAVSKFHLPSTSGEADSGGGDAEKEKCDEKNGEKINEIVADTDEDEKAGFQFNSDLLCDHGCLNPDRGCRRLVTPDIWHRLRAYFPACPEYKRDDSVCEQCQQLSAEEEQAKCIYRQSALTQKSELHDLFNGRNRPKLIPNNQIIIVSTPFIEEWRRFIKDNGRREPVTSISNSVLLCEHEGLLYPPTMNGHGELSEWVCFLWPSEWTKLTNYMSFDVEISAIQLVEPDGRTQLFTSPKICHDCVMNRLATEELNKFIFKDCVIYVRKVANDKKNGVENNRNSNTTKIVSGGSNSNDSGDVTMDDPDYTQSQAKKKKTEEGTSMEVSEEKMDDPSSFRRKSQRHRRTRGEKEILVSSDMTVRELKFKILKQFCVPPMDQNLYLDGLILNDDTRTLQDFKLFPGAIIVLKADEPLEDPEQYEDLYRGVAKPEMGFQGTNLLSS